ncbi:hypothetical protein AAFC00_000589 [Neodothiora populina]|uniref:Ankyrin n=1 Tax=Neodothiora populina TaxID=2781224 RepID=A0ABR3PDM6_9PEZI
MADTTTTTNPARLTADEIDDILYLTRTNDTAELLGYLSQLSQQHGAAGPHAVLEACVDEDSQNTAVHYAAANGSTDLLRALLTLFPSPAADAVKKTLLNRHNGAGNTPLHWAALNGHSSTVQLLTESGADVWVKNAAGNLPVFEAERAGKDEVVAVLLLAGGKEVEEQLKRKEGDVTKDDEVDVDSANQASSSGSSAAAAGGADEAAEKMQKTSLDG